MNFWKKSTFLYALFILTAGCGTNTDNPVYPIFSLITPASPAIINLQAVEVTSYELEAPKIEFDLSYYVSNTEPQFQGYNLYLTTASLPPEVILAGNTGSLYLPLGYEPTFPHTEEEASTASADLKTVRIQNFKPAPGLIQFQRCERYFFTLRAVLIGNLTSPPGPQASACAAVDTSLCPADSACGTD